MRYYILLVSLLFCTVFSKAQSQEKNVLNNTNSNSGKLKEQHADTTALMPQVDEIRIESRTKKARAAKSTDISAPKFEAPDEKKSEDLKDSNASIQQLSSAKFQFESNYKDSKHQLYRRSASNLELSNMKKSALLYTQMLPGSFENYFYTYLLNKYDPKHFPELQQAARLNPEHTEVQQELAAYGVAVNDQELTDSVAREMIAQNKITPGLLTYSTDLINSVPANGTLLLHGYTELIPAYYEMNTMGRTDLELISVDLMQSPDYQANLAAKGFVIPGSLFVDTAFVQAFCSMNVSRNIYLSMSFPKEYFQGMSQSLSPVGLTFAYNQNNLDQNAWNTSLIQNSWKKAELGTAKDPVSDALSANYLPTLISIQKMYEAYNQTENAREISNIIMNVAIRARKTAQLSKIQR